MTQDARSREWFSTYGGNPMAWAAAVAVLDVMGSALVSLLAFVRLSTDARVFEVPMGTQEAIEAVMSWLSAPIAREVSPTRKHWPTIGEVASRARAKGPEVSDAHLATLAREHGASICSTDRGFRRYGVRLIDPTD